MSASLGQKALALLLGCPLAACGDDVPPGADSAPTGTDATGATADASQTDATDTTATAWGESGAANTGDETGPQPDPRLVVTADWLAGTLSLLDAEALAGGAETREAMLVDTVDLSMYAPGPLQVELTPDATTAVVSISPGFFDGFVGGVLGVGEVAAEGRLLLVDLPSRSVAADLSPAHVPMGIAITADGATAYTANYGVAGAEGSTMTIVDMVSATITEDIEVGGRPEQVSLSTDGTLGIINLAADGAVRTFGTADPAGTLSVPLVTSGDPSDVDFLEGTDYAIVVNSQDPSNYAIVDVSDPAAPSLVEDAPGPGGIPYAATPIAGTADAVITLSDFGNVFLARVAGAESPSSLVWKVEVPETPAFPLGVAVDPALGLTITGAPGADVLLIGDLDGGAVRRIPWLDATGPTYVAIAAE